MKTDGLISALGLCARAKKLTVGYAECERLLKKGGAQLVVITSDAAERTKRNAIRLCENATPYRVLPLCIDDTAAVGRFAVAAITDRELARLVDIKAQQQEEETAYDD